jgi:hypothetical protein
MLAVYSKEDKELNLSRYRDGIFGLLKSNKNLSETKNMELWMEVFTASPTERSRKHVISELSGIEKKWAGRLITEIVNTPNLDKSVKDYATEKLSKRNK